MEYSDGRFVRIPALAPKRVYGNSWHEADQEQPLRVGLITATSPTLGAECPFSGAFETWPEAALRVGS